MANPIERDTIQGHAGSADPENYRARRQGDLTRQSDGFRTKYPDENPRRPLTGGTDVHPPLAPYHYNPHPPHDGEALDVPRTWAYLRPATPGAPRVGFPDARRTGGKLQHSGEAWGRVGESRRDALHPRVDGNDGPPTLRIGPRGDTELIPRSSGPRWTRPTVPTIRDQWLNH